LLGRRLFPLDRRILLGAADASATDGHAAVPTSPANSDRVMLRRSIAKLQRFGLLDYRTSWLKAGERHGSQMQIEGLPEHGWSRLVRRTVLGDEVVRLYARELYALGSRIRWDGRLYEAIGTAHAACPHEPT
jgi:hypothetical protein